MTYAAEKNNKIVFLLKSLRSEYVEDTMEKGRFCFNKPSVFSTWEDKNAAQFDRWDAHSAYEAFDLVYAPINKDEGGVIEYGTAKRFADKAIIHEQGSFAKQSFICCFRYLTPQEVEFCNNGIRLSLGMTANRIIEEFGHDSFLVIHAQSFLDRVAKKVPNSSTMIQGAVVYKDLLYADEFPFPEPVNSRISQLYRKDAIFSWQQEFRVVIASDNSSTEIREFIEIGPIYDIACYGKLSDLVK